MKNTSASARTPRAVGAHGPLRRDKASKSPVKERAGGRPAAGARSGWTARGGRGAQASATTRAAQGGGGACDGASEPPVEERAGGLVARRQGRVWDGSASVPTWTSGGGQGVMGQTTRDRARAVDAASATTSQTTQARCHTGTSFIHCRRLETYNLISIHNSFYYLLPRECGGQRADEEQQAAGSSSESSNIADVLDELRGIPPERDRKVESSLMPASQSSY